jgi:hypothetical protein
LTAVASYNEFLSRKARLACRSGFAPTFIPDAAKPFQRSLIEWNTWMGRSGTFADCGLGKTLIQLAWAENVVRHENGRVLVATPLAVGPQTVREGEKFGIECRRSRDGSLPSRIVVTNVEQLHHFSPDDFAGFCLDESSILKNIDGTRRRAITEFMGRVKYRLLCTATAAPNDYDELGTSSEALGYLGARDMLGRFFKQETKKDFLGWGRTTYRFRGHAEEAFWRWVCSWARACRRPSDLGFDDEGYVLPPLIEREHVVENSTPRPGMLFAAPAVGLREQREERRVTLRERCEAAAGIANAHDGASVVWCHLNDEGDALEELVDGGVQVSGSMPEEEKEEKLIAFSAGQIRRLVTKPKLGCWGLNWQHCHNVVTFPSHSWEQYYQSNRRCWRFGQTEPVTVTVVATAGVRGVMANLRRKAEQCDRMFTALVRHMREAMVLDGGWHFDKREEIPPWLC